MLQRTRDAAHANCAICSRRGLGLRFAVDDDGGVEAPFEPPETCQGYDGMLHGGVISALLDSAMTHCLFARGIVAVTGEMTVRFRHPVTIGDRLVVGARVSRSQRPLHLVEARLAPGGVVTALAAAKFMETGRRPGAGQAACVGECDEKEHRP